MSGDLTEREAAYTLSRSRLMSMAHGARAFGRRVPRDDLLPRVPDRRVPARATGSTAIASRVAEMLGVSRASAGEMLKRLEADGLVERGEQKEAILTPRAPSGRSASCASTGSSSASSRTSWATRPRESHVHADELGDTFTEEMVERINERLGRPGPLPARLAGRHRSSSRPRTGSSSPLAELEAGARRDRAPRRARRRPPPLVLRRGARPGHARRGRAAQPAAEQLTIAVDGAERAISEGAADGILRPRGVGTLRIAHALLRRRSHRGARIRPSRGDRKENGLHETESTCRRGARRLGAAPRRRRRRAGGVGPRRWRHSLRRATRDDRRAARVTGEQLQADLRARLLARIDAAEKAGRISSERAAALRTRISEGTLCAGRHHVRARVAVRGIEGSRRLPGARPRGASRTPSGKLSRSARREAGQERVGARGRDGRAGQGASGKAVASGRITQARADAALERSRRRRNGSRRSIPDRLRLLAGTIAAKGPRAGPSLS